MDDLAAAIDDIATSTDFSGVVRVESQGERFAAAYGMAHRGFGVANTVDTRFAIASGVKGLTALAVLSLVVDGTLDLATTARSVLGADLPLIDDGVTVEHLLAHRSGIGDYFDEELDNPINDYALPGSVHELATTEQFLRVLDGFPTKFAPGERFGYCNGGYVVLALIAERVSGVPFHDLVATRVCEPAGMRDTAFLRSDESSTAALGYLAKDGLRTNVFHLPILGSGDGGIYSTAADIHRLWSALFAGAIVPSEWVAKATHPRETGAAMPYGLGFWLPDSVVRLVGYDAGVSFSSTHDPAGAFTYAVLSNTSDGVWPLARHLNKHFDVA